MARRYRAVGGLIAMPSPIAAPLPGMWVLELEPRRDQRGSFTRLFCSRALAELGLEQAPTQVNLAHSDRAGTLRGLHWQAGPAAETKLVVCLAGALHDCVLDMRPGSPTFGRHALVELASERPFAVLVPAGCAHGYLTTREATSVLYLTTAAYAPEHERAVRWDDPRFAIAWPSRPSVLSERDRAIPDWAPAEPAAACASC